MSNLRSDCRAIAGRLPAGDLYRAHLICCCAQIDEIEEYWHAAERRARDAEYKVELWRWLTAMRCHVVEDADITRADRWLVVDVDGDIVERGVNPQSAIECAKTKIERRIPAEA
jgi:hypothetical protein